MHDSVITDMSGTPIGKVYIEDDKAYLVPIVSNFRHISLTPMVSHILGEDDKLVGWNLVVTPVTERDPEAKLGCATTEELLRELKTRGEMSILDGAYTAEAQSMASYGAVLLNGLPAELLNYRTVDHGRL